MDDDLETTVILPFYKKDKELEVSMVHNYKYFKQSGVELVVVADEPIEKEKFNFMEKYPEVMYKVIVNRKKHRWRNPAVVINIGLRFATKKYVLVMSPESVMTSNMIQTFHNVIKNKSFVIGRVALVNVAGEFELDFMLKNEMALKKLRWMPFGSIYVDRQGLIDAGGYDETFKGWGGEDNEVRIRLSALGHKKIMINNTRLLHYQIGNRKGTHRRRPPGLIKYIEQLKKNKSKLGAKDFSKHGLEFDEVLIDWK